MDRLDPDRAFGALERTWPPARVIAKAPWRVFDGQGGGKRVSAAVADAPIPEEETDAAIDLAEQVQVSLGQPSLFMLHDGEEALDARLDARGYELIDPVRMLAINAAKLAAHAPTTPLNGPPQVVTCEMPLAIMAELWAEDGIGPHRLAVMARATQPHYLMARMQDRLAGCAFLGIDGDVAIIHSLMVAPDHRRHGLGAALTILAARIAQEAGATWLALAVTRENAGACRLYEGLGFSDVAAYHYRIRTET